MMRGLARGTAGRLAGPISGRTAVVLIAAVVLTTACASGPKPPKETKLKSNVVAGEALNPNRRGRSQPVKLHVYYLKQDEAFLQANFNDLIHPDAAPIAEDLVRRTESLVGPGETRSLDEKFDKQTQFIGVVAEFTQIDDAQWRALAAVPQGQWKKKLLFQGQMLEISLNELTVSCDIVKD